MVFGQGDSKKSVYILNTVVGIIGFVICIFNCFVVCKHPAFQKGGEFYTDPNVLCLCFCNTIGDSWCWIGSC